MKPPPPTPLTDPEYVENLRIVLNGVCNALAKDLDAVQRIRNDETGIIIHSQGVEIFRRADIVDLATEQLMIEIEDELGGREN